MKTPSTAWNAILPGLARSASNLFLPAARAMSREQRLRNGSPEILAVMPAGPNRRALVAMALQQAWTLTLADELQDSDFSSGRKTHPIVIYDRDVAPDTWKEDVAAFALASPRPCVILLSASLDLNLWDKFQQLGGSDILRTPLDRDQVVWAVERAWLVWSAQRQTRSAASRQEMTPLRTA